jgi:hypothetical protein
MSTVYDTARIMDKLDIPSVVHIDTRERRDVVTSIGPSIYLGRAFDYRTYPITEYLVTAHRYDRDWPGTEQAFSFAVERMVIIDGRKMSDYSVGFFHESECWRYLTGRGTMRATVYDLDGRESTVDRTCLGIPEGFTERGDVL